MNPTNQELSVGSLQLIGIYERAISASYSETYEKVVQSFIRVHVHDGIIDKDPPPPDDRRERFIMVTLWLSIYSGFAIRAPMVSVELG